MKGKNFYLSWYGKLNSRKTKPSLYCVIKKNVNSLPLIPRKKKENWIDCVSIVCGSPTPLVFSWWSGSYYTQPVPSF